jgi:hypothetical protein
MNNESLLASFLQAAGALSVAMLDNLEPDARRAVSEALLKGGRLRLVLALANFESHESQVTLELSDGREVVEVARIVATPPMDS